MDTTPRIFQYEDKPISFINSEGTVMVNATEMAKPFGKLASGWLRNQSTQDFIKELAAMQNCLPSDLLRVINGDKGGTWMHEDVALEFARWLSPKFAIWCNDRIKELFKEDQAKHVKEEFVTRSQVENAVSDLVVDLNVLKYLTKSLILELPETATSTELAAKYNMKPWQLNRKMVEYGFLERTNDGYAPTPTGVRLQLTEEKIFKDKYGEPHPYLVWTRRGNVMISLLFWHNVEFWIAKHILERLFLLMSTQGSLGEVLNKMIESYDRKEL